MNNRFFFLLTAVFLFSLSISVPKPVLPNYVLSFGASFLMVGSILSGLGYSRLFIEIPLGVAIDRHGKRKIVILGALLSAFGAFLGGLAFDLSFLFIYVILSGVSGSFFFAPTFAMVNDLAPPKKTGSYFGGNIAAIFLGPIFGPLLGGYLADAFGLRMTFLVSSVIALAALGFVYLGTRGFEEHLLPKGKYVSPLSYIKKVYNSRSLFFINFLGFCNPFTMSCISVTVLPIYTAKILGLDYILVGLVFAVISFSSFLVCAPSGVLSDKLGRVPLITAGFSLFAVATFVYPFTNSFLVALLPSVLLGLGDGLISPAMWASLSDSTDVEDKAISVGVFRTFIAAGLLTGPLVAGILLNSQNIAVPFYLVSAVTLLTAIGNIILNKKSNL